MSAPLISDYYPDNDCTPDFYIITLTTSVPLVSALISAYYPDNEYSPDVSLLPSQRM
jgi:hypothetical protein